VHGIQVQVEKQLQVDLNDIHIYTLHHTQFKSQMW